jgi:hypothetical protein
VPDAFDDLAVHGQSTVEVQDQVRQVKPPLAGDFTLHHPLDPDQLTGSKEGTHRVLHFGHLSHLQLRNILIALLYRRPLAPSVVTPSCAREPSVSGIPMRNGILIRLIAIMTTNTYSGPKLSQIIPDR